MLDILKSLTLDEFILICILVLSVLALFISILAYRRAGKIVPIEKSKHQNFNHIVATEPVLQRYKSIDVSLMLSAKRNAKDQLRLIIKNTGIVTARDIDFVIGNPIRVIKKEELVDGITDTVEITNSALKPRLTVIDARTIFPINEIQPGVIYDIFAVTTMGYGKICDFPISISWLDDRGTRHFQDEVVTI